MPKITKRLVDAADPRATRYYLWDQAVSGFGLVVQPSGMKSFCYQYRTPEGATRRITLGRYSESNTPDQARQRAKGYQKSVDSGRDPMGEKQSQKDALKVSDLLDRYLQSAKFAEKAELTRKTDAGRIVRHLKPLLGNKIADKLTTDQIRKASADIEEGKTAGITKTGPRGLARVKGGPGAARMCIRLLKSVYSWAESESLITKNPAAPIKVPQDGRRNITLSPEEYERLFQTIEEMEERRQLRRPVADAIRVIALTGARRGEIAGLRWRHVNLKKGIVEIPRNEHKTGKKTGESRIIGLPAVAQAIISRQPAGDLESFVFSPSAGAGPLSLSKPWRSIRENAALDPQIGLHGLRHSLATQMALSGSQAAHIMAVMGHRDMSTSQKYIHIAQDVRSELAEKAAAGISAAFSRDDLKSDVVALKAKAK